MLSKLLNWFLYSNEAGINIPKDALTKSDYVNSFRKPPSVIKYFIFQNYDAEHQIIRFKDGKSGGILIEIEPKSCEAKPDAFIEEMHKSFYELIKNGFEESDNPFVCQITSYYDQNLTETIESIDKYQPTNSFGPVFKERQLEHIKMIESEKGIFKEGTSNKAWRGKKQRVYLTLYRESSTTWEQTIEELKDAKERIFASLKTAGLKHRLCRQYDFINLLFPLLTPSMFQAENINDYIRDVKLGDEKNISEGIEKNPLNMDIGDFVAQAPIESLDRGIWKTGDKFNVAIPVSYISAEPTIGHLTREREIGGNKTSLFEELPIGSRWVTTIIFEKQDKIKKHVEYIDSQSSGSSNEAQNTRNEAQLFYKELSDKNKAYNVTHTLYLQQNSEEELLIAIKDSSSLLRMHNLPLVDFNEDIYIMDCFIRNLPFNYNIELDRTKTQRRNFTYADHLASLLPFYGRARGTGHSAITLFNTGGESFSVDLIRDRLKNAHVDIFGPAGAGKSATLNYLLQSMVSAMDVRVVIVDLKYPYPSFGLLVDWFKKCGLTVKKYTYSAKNPVPTPPFKSIRSLFDSKGVYKLSELDMEEYLNKAETEDINEDDGTSDTDILGQMLEIASIMLTEIKSNTDMLRAEKSLLTKALILAGKNTYHNDVGYPLISDLINAINELSESKETKNQSKKKLERMAGDLDFFTEGLAGQIFNRPGDGFEDADIVLIELASLTKGSNEDSLIAIFMAILQNVQSLAMNNVEGKNTIVVCDETHVVLKHKKLAEYLTIVKKVFRASGIWLWTATQDFEDMPIETRKMINNSDWFIGLSMTPPEVKILNEFKTLTDEQLKQVETCNIEKGKYSEMVLIHPKWSALCRAVLPAIVFATAQTEMEERAHRQQLMRDHNLDDEHDAVLMIEQSIINERKKGGYKEVTEWQ